MLYLENRKHPVDDPKDKILAPFSLSPSFQQPDVSLCATTRVLSTYGVSPSFAAVAFEGEEGADRQKHNRHGREKAGDLNGPNPDHEQPSRKQYS